MNPRNFFSELKRRKVYRVVVAYAVAAWLLAQIATQVFPFFEIPNWAVRLVIVLLILGFPVALILSWAFDITPEGIKRTDEVLPQQTRSSIVPEKSIAVLPFENLSDDQQNTYFADGIQDDILSNLAKVADLKLGHAATDLLRDERVGNLVMPQHRRPDREENQLTEAVLDRGLAPVFLCSPRPPMH